MAQDYKILIGGIISVGLLYLIPAYMSYIWLGLFLALFGSVFFLIVLYKFGKKDFTKTDSEKTTVTFFSILVFSSFLIFGFDYYKADFQKELLREIRVTIDSSIIETEIRAELLEAYREYLLSNRKNNVSVIEVATDFFGERLKDDQKFQIRKKELEEELNFIYHKEPESDSFTIYATAEHSKSWAQDFENRDGSVGLLQTKTTLTNQGVTHERQN